MSPRKPITLKNVGPISGHWLAKAGIRRRSDVIRLGPVEAYLRVKKIWSRASLNLLWALAGAERGLQWSRLPAEDRQRLLLELDAAQAQGDGVPKTNE